MTVGDTPVAILAGGLATRLGATVATLPKALVPVAGRPFIDHQLALLRDAGARRVVLCVKHMASAIEAHLGDGAAHGLAILLQRSGRREEMFTDRRKRSFLVHLFAYVAVNALLIAVNLLYSPGYYWFLFPLIGWGVLLAAHAYIAFFRGRGAARTGVKS